MVVRDLGQWLLPRDVEDEEDYDWKELSPESHKKLIDILKALQESSGYTFHFSIGEKNYIYFE